MCLEMGGAQFIGDCNLLQHHLNSTAEVVDGMRFLVHLHRHKFESACALCYILCYGWALTKIDGGTTSVCREDFTSLSLILSCNVRPQKIVSHPDIWRSRVLSISQFRRLRKIEDSSPCWGGYGQCSWKIHWPTIDSFSREAADR